MSGQIPDWPVRFDVRIGRRILWDPAYLSVNIEARGLWLEANLIATEFDGRVPDAALHARCIAEAWTREHYDDTIQSLVDNGLFEETTEGPDGDVWYIIVGWEKYQPDPLEKHAPGPADETPEERKKRLARERQQRRRSRVTQPVTLVTPVTLASRSVRDNVTQPVTQSVTHDVTLPTRGLSRSVTSVTQPVTSRPRASTSTSSSVSEIRRANARGENGVSRSLPTPAADAVPGALKDKLAQYGYAPGGPDKAVSDG